MLLQEANAGQKVGEAKAVKLYGQIPPIEKMDASLSTLVNCEKLSLSTNCIEKIANLNGLKNLRILSLGRNNIKNLNGLEAVGETLEELWISYNLIEKLKGIHVMKKLKVLYMSNNLVKDWGEFVKLADLPSLADLVFVGNPIEEKYSSEGSWLEEATKRLPKLKKLDGEFQCFEVHNQGFYLFVVFIYNTSMCCILHIKCLAQSLQNCIGRDG
ncbi:DNAL1 protein, partial [Polyodon spathula]|nr:DNAL1 protein [Polyodon spathula]